MNTCLRTEFREGSVKSVKKKAQNVGVKKGINFPSFASLVMKCVIVRDDQCVSLQEQEEIFESILS